MEISYRIRPARTADSFAIRALCLKLNVSRDSTLDSGFLEYHVHSAPHFAEWIDSNELFYVAEGQGKVIGFFACYDDERLDRLSDRKCPMERFVLDQARPFIYGDVMGIDRQYARQGIGEYLLDNILEHPKALGKDLWGAIALRPFLNKGSQGLVLSKGFELEDEVITDAGLVFGMYKRSGVVGPGSEV